jgi:hypothetical protein
MALPRTLRKKLGDLLIERRIITPEQLDAALREQKKKGGYLSKHLIALGFTTETDIAVCLSNQYNFAYLPLKNYSIPGEVLEVIPLKWIKIYTLIPVDRIDGVLSVAMADPLNEGVIQVLQQITNCEIYVYISTYSEINEAINKYYGEKLRDLKEAYLDTRDLAKIMVADDFIQTKVYNGPERRIYVRINKGLEINFYFHGKTFLARTKDISYGGVAFFSPVFIPVDTDLACKIHLVKDKLPIDVVMTILRVQEEGKTEDENIPSQGYVVAGMFEFMTAEDRESLVSFLKQNIT